MSARRRTTLRLTDVEEQELERLRRQLHDGPIQLLTALSWRLSLLGASTVTSELNERVAEVSSEMRAVMMELGRNADLSAGEQLERWIAPLVSGTPLEMTIEDHLTERPSDELIHAAFLFLYELVRATRDLPLRRQQSMSLDHERGGYRMVLTTTTGGSTLAGAPAAQFRTMVEFARSLGGSLEAEDGDARIRTFSLWLPPTAVTPTDGAEARAATRRPTSLHPAEWIHLADRAIPCELDGAGWELVLSSAPEPIAELDQDLRWTYVNHAYEALEAAPASELTDGGTVVTRFQPDEVAALQPQIARARQLETVEFDLARRNADGDLRFIRINASPRSGDAGEFVGALVVLEDLSDHHYLDGLQASAFDDLARARARVRHALFERLRTPLTAMEEIVDMVGALAPSVPDSRTMAHIRNGLADAMRRIRRSIDLLAVPDLTDGDLGRAVRESVTPLLPSDVRVEFIDELDAAIAADATETLFRIAREAVINAAIHGGARRVEMRRREERDGLTLEIRSDGTPVDPAALDAPPDHVGVRLMTERAHARGGTCTIEPDGQDGTVVSVWLPRRNP